MRLQQPFTAEQREQLKRQLSSDLGNQTDEAVRKIEIAYKWASSLVVHDMEPVWAAENAKFRKHFSKLAKASKQLRDLIAWQGPKEQHTDWRSLLGALELLEKSAKEEIADRPKPGRGPRKRFTWRDSVIAVIFNLYPPGRATKSRNSNFERTVSMVVEWIDGPTSDIHDVIIDALKRQPRPSNAFQFLIDER